MGFLPSGSEKFRIALSSKVATGHVGVGIGTEQLKWGEYEL